MNPWDELRWEWIGHYTATVQLYGVPVSKNTITRLRHLPEFRDEWETLCSTRPMEHISAKKKANQACS